jgi:hypothetical protein
MTLLICYMDIVKTYFNAVNRIPAYPYYIQGPATEV